MHILHLIKTTEGAIWALHLMQKLKINYPQISFSVALPLGGINTKEYLILCRDVYDFDYKLNLTIFNNGLKLIEIVNKDQPDIIHSWFTQTTLYARLFLKKFNIPRLFQVVGPLHLENRLFKWADVISANKNDYWIATSKYIFNKYKNFGVNEKHLFLNYAYTDIQQMLSDKNKIESLDLRNKYNIPENYKIIGTASFIYPPKFYEKTGVKGHEYLLKAFERLLTRRDDVILVIAGATFGNSLTYENKLKNIAAKIDPKRIIFTGKYEHVFEVISNFDVFVYLSKSENLGGVFESLLFEIPTVCSNRGALPELVIDGVTGYLVELNNINQITNKIEIAIDEKNIEMVKNGRNLMNESFLNDHIIKKAYDIYEKLIN